MKKSTIICVFALAFSYITYAQDDNKEPSKVKKERVKTFEPTISNEEKIDVKGRNKSKTTKDGEFVKYEQLPNDINPFEISPEVRQTDPVADSLFNVAYQCYIDDNYEKSFPIFYSLSKQEYRKAYAYLGLAYELGEGTEKDAVKMKYYYDLAIKNNDYWVGYRMGNVYTEQGNDQAAFQYFKISANHENGWQEEASLKIAVMYEKGIGTEMNLSKAIEYYRQAAKKGNYQAINKLEDYSIAIYDKSAYSEFTAEQIVGLSSEELFNMGENYLKPFNDNSYNPPLGFACMKASADANYPYAQMKVAEIYNNKSEPIYSPDKSEKYYKMAISSFKQLIDNVQDAKASYELGYLYAKGKGTKVKIDSAMYYYEKAAIQKEQNAAWRLGLVYQEQAQYEEAFKWFLIGAENGQGMAMYEIAKAYEMGIGTHKDISQAISWYQKCSKSHYSASSNAERALRRLNAYDVASDEIDRDMDLPTTLYTKKQSLIKSFSSDYQVKSRNYEELLLLRNYPQLLTTNDLYAYNDSLFNCYYNCILKLLNKEEYVQSYFYILKAKKIACKENNNKTINYLMGRCFSGIAMQAPDSLEGHSPIDYSIKAIKCFKKSKAYTMLAKEYANIAEHYFEKGDTSVGRRYINYSVKYIHNKDLARAENRDSILQEHYFRLGYLLYPKIEAHSYYEESLKYGSTIAIEKYKVTEAKANAHSNMALLDNQQGNWKEAIDHYKKAIVLYELTDSFDTAYSYLRGIGRECYRLGFLYEMHEKYDSAFVYLNRAAECYKNDEDNILEYANCLNSLAYCCYYLDKNINRSIDIIEKAIRLCPQEPNYVDSKGELLLMSGDMDGAIQMWEKVLELDPDVLVHWKERGIVSVLYQKLKEAGKI